jgi:hypothetical protein
MNFDSRVASMNMNIGPQDNLHDALADLEEANHCFLDPDDPGDFDVISLEAAGANDYIFNGLDNIYMPKPLPAERSQLLCTVGRECSIQFHSHLPTKTLQLYGPDHCQFPSHHIR